MNKKGGDAKPLLAVKADYEAASKRFHAAALSMGQRVKTIVDLEETILEHIPQEKRGPLAGIFKMLAEASAEFESAYSGD